MIERKLTVQPELFLVAVLHGRLVGSVIMAAVISHGTLGYAVEERISMGKRLE